jgi:hypothetical protein
MMKQKLLPESPGVAYCPSRTASRFSIEGIPGQNLNWAQWGVPNGYVENGYVFIGPRKMNWTNSTFCMSADVFYKDTGENGVQYGTFFGAPKDHGDNYYITLFSDGSVHKYIDRTNYFANFLHSDADFGLSYLTGAVQ